MTKKEAYKSIAFVALFLFLLYTLSTIVRSGGDLKERFAGFYAEKNNTIDVVMIGSSRVYNGYAVPQLYGETGIAAYMLSTNVQRPAAAIWLTKEAMKTQQPELVVYDMQMFLREEELLTYNMAFTRGVTDNMDYSWNRIETINALVPEEDEEGRLSYYIDLFKYHGNWKMLVFPEQLRTVYNRAKSPMKGYVCEDTVGQIQTPEISDALTPKPMPAEQEAHLRELCAFLRDNGQNALFIVTPGTTDDEEMAGYDYIEAVVAAYGYPFLNMNRCYDEIGLSFQRDYKDEGNHLNALGAEKVTAFLGDCLTGKRILSDPDGKPVSFSFEDHRGDPVYQSWDASYELWKTEYEAASRIIEQRIADGDWYDPDSE